MKKQFVIAFILFLLCYPNKAQSQDENDYYDAITGVSLYGSSNTIFTPLNLTFDFLYKGKNKGLGGISLGVSSVISNRTDETSFLYGPHMLYTYLSNRNGNNHFEFKVGALMVFNDESFIPMPALVLGYRFQPVNGNLFLRIGFGTSGLGMGLGYIIKRRPS